MAEERDTTRWAPVRDWHTAVNGRDLTAARAVADPDVRIGGPQGSTRGVEVFLDWIRESGVRLVPVAWHEVDDERVVVEQDATWPGRAGSGSDAAPRRTATLFEVRHGLVTAVLRYDEGVDTALAAARQVS
ncbi:nuclear transport factor 2 family protein [Nocardiopsis quinghaiensis]|uniref:nuclear transport factor 2 family protein n=1 Tax=Nocardiopsis quinghaiensis TaxID=464995 RepID=UPI00123A2265|nr:nuclear transport factor 2 family protein [Nocardiopsis quinghaiensis]